MDSGFHRHVFFSLFPLSIKPKSVLLFFIILTIFAFSVFLYYLEDVHCSYSCPHTINTGLIPDHFIHFTITTHCYQKFYLLFGSYILFGSRAKWFFFHQCCHLSNFQIVDTFTLQYLSYTELKFNSKILVVYFE